GDDLGVDGRVLVAQRLHVELVELTVAPGLRSLVTEHGAQRVQPDRLGQDMEAVLDVGAKQGGGRLRPQGDRLSAAVRKGIHLLLDDVGALADPAREQLRSLEQREADLLVPVGLEGAAGRGLHTLPLHRLAGQDIPYATHCLDGHAGDRPPYPVRGPRTAPDEVGDHWHFGNGWLTALYLVPLG